MRPEALVTLSVPEQETVATGLAEGLVGGDARRAGPWEQEGPTAPAEADEGIFFDFVSGAQEQLATAETALLTLESRPNDAESLGAVFRSFHTIKGAAGFLNLQDVAGVAHVVEDLLDLQRRRGPRPDAAMPDLVLEAVDLLRELIASTGDRMADGRVLPRDVSEFTARARNAAQDFAEPPSTAGRAAWESAPAAAGNGGNAAGAEQSLFCLKGCF